MKNMKYIISIELFLLIFSCTKGKGQSTILSISNTFRTEQSMNYQDQRISNPVYYTMNTPSVHSYSNLQTSHNFIRQYLSTPNQIDSTIINEVQPSTFNFILSRQHLETNPERSERFLPKNLFGISYSKTSGYGISYRYSGNNNFSLRLTGFYWKYLYTDQTQTEFVFGSELQYNLLRANDFRIYCNVGGSYKSFFTNITDIQYTLQDDEVIQIEYRGYQHDLTETYNFGIGIGSELIFWDFICLNADIGFRYERKMSALDILFLNFQPPNFSVRTIREARKLSFGIGLGYVF